MTVPTVRKEVESAIKYPLTTKYKFVGGDRVQDMLAKDLIQLFRQHTKDPWTRKDCQILWFAVHIDEKPGPAKTLAKMKIVLVVLSVIHKEDRDLIAKGYSPKKVWRFKVARLCNEACKQNSVLSQFDLAEMLCVSLSTIGRDIRKYEKEFGVILPYRVTQVRRINPSW